jgi:DNA-binding NarL/FixJ family response regulator
MKKRIATALGSDSIYNYLIKRSYEVIPDISYQEGVLEIIKKDFIDVLIIYSELNGDFDKYIFIDKIKQVDSKMKIIIVADKEDENYKKFLGVPII